MKKNKVPDFDEWALGCIGKMMDDGTIPRVFIRVERGKVSKEIELCYYPDDEALDYALKSLDKYVEIEWKKKQKNVSVNHRNSKNTKSK